MPNSQKDKRFEKRKRLIYYLKVFDVDNNVLLGNLVDITVRGMMLISEEPVPSNNTYNLKIILPRKIQDKDSIQVEAKSLWSKNDINPVLYDSGFQFSKLTNEKKQIVEDLLLHVSFDD